MPIGLSTLSTSTTTGAEATEEESKDFNEWLLRRWREKDERLDLFRHDGILAKKCDHVDIPVKLKDNSEIVALLFSWVLGLWIAKKLWDLSRAVFRVAF